MVSFSPPSSVIAPWRNDVPDLYRELRDLVILSDVTLCHIVTLSWLYSHG